jgi:hypothetical protein
VRILFSTLALAELGGTETYALTVADQLQRMGHDVWLHAERFGETSDLADSLGLRVARSASEMPADPDVILAQTATQAFALADTYPAVPQAFIAHSDVFDDALPPQLPGVTGVVVTLYDRVEQRVDTLAVKTATLRLTQPVDVERFRPLRPLPDRARVAVALGNWLHGERFAVLQRACARAGIELRRVGSRDPAGTRSADQVLNDADIVFGKARVIVEALACGRAAYVYDASGADGWVTPRTYARLAADNFGGQMGPPVDEDALVADLAGYDPALGIVGRDLAVAHHSSKRHATALVDALQRLAPRAEPVDAPLVELSRLVRVVHRMQSDAFEARSEAHRVHCRLADLDDQLQQAKAEGAEAAAALAQSRADMAALADALQRAHAEADRAWDAVRTVTATRRWRAAQGIMRPIDQMRGR